MIRTETIVVGICAVILILAMIANVVVSKTSSTDSVFCTTKLCMILAILFVLLPLALIQVYSVQCMLEGNCDRFVWIFVGIAVVLTLVYIGLFVYKIIKQKRE